MKEVSRCAAESSTIDACQSFLYSKTSKRVFLGLF